jgi:hypothetical protein
MRTGLVAVLHFENAECDPEYVTGYRIEQEATEGTETETEGTCTGVLLVRSPREVPPAVSCGG